LTHTHTRTNFLSLFLLTVCLFPCPPLSLSHTGWTAAQSNTLIHHKQGTHIHKHTHTHTEKQALFGMPKMKTQGKTLLFFRCISSSQARDEGCTDMYEQNYLSISTVASMPVCKDQSSVEPGPF